MSSTRSVGGKVATFNLTGKALGLLDDDPSLDLSSNDQQDPGRAAAPSVVGSDAGPSPLITFSFAPPVASSDGNASAQAASAPTSTVILVEDYGSGAPRSGPPGIDFFAKGGNPGRGGGGGGGTV